MEEYRGLESLSPTHSADQTVQMGEIETIAFHIYQKVLSFQSAVSNLDINKCSGLIRGCGLGVEAWGGFQTSSEGVLNWWSNAAGVNSCCMCASEWAWVFACACEQRWELSKHREELERPHSGQSLSKWPWGQNWTTVHKPCKTDMKGWNRTHTQTPLTSPLTLIQQNTFAHVQIPNCGHRWDKIALQQTHFVVCLNVHSTIEENCGWIKCAGYAVPILHIIFCTIWFHLQMCL